MAGGVLKLHPRIEVNNGKMNPGKKYRGRMKNVVLDYVKDMEEELKKAVHYCFFRKFSHTFLLKLFSGNKKNS